MELLNKSPQLENELCAKESIDSLYKEQAHTDGSNRVIIGQIMRTSYLDDSYNTD